MNEPILPKTFKLLEVHNDHGLRVYDGTTCYDYILFEHGVQIENVRYYKRTNTMFSYNTRNYYCSFDESGRKHGCETKYAADKPFIAVWEIKWKHGRKSYYCSYDVSGRKHGCETKYAADKPFIAVWEIKWKHGKNHKK